LSVPELEVLPSQYGMQVPSPKVRYKAAPYPAAGLAREGKHRLPVTKARKFGKETYVGN